MNFGNATDWHLSPEQSLQLRSGERALPLQLQIWTKAGHNQLVVPPQGCSLFLYRAPNMLPSKAESNEGGLRLVELAPALVGRWRQILSAAERRKPYMDAIEKASTGHDIGPFSAFLGQLIKEQTATP